MKVTIYLPDDLAAEVKAELSDYNISAICQGALRAELDRVKARAGLGPEDFERVELDVDELNRDIKDHPVAFQGRKVAQADYHDLEAYITPKGGIVVYDDYDRTAWTYEDYDEFMTDDQPADLIAGVAEALGEKYVEELDI
jgi:hypothetical protein